MPLSVTVQNSAGEVLFGPEDMPEATPLSEIKAKLPAAGEGKTWSLFTGSVKVSEDTKISDVADDGKVLVNASHSSVAEKAANEKAAAAP
eukprot:CAMPEP_0179043884 /NCGR_PEP_ID=MMETSP0796-20121207/17390_1 /TAXON_ID=73915 /ORGANISM="Pyrodinium bahamense, Strain pbaha01" /LENGTH=89 /DNA_ID=CAMNT_0020740269 /DNA_START=61 /DNA_END=330 /DNA_ORIENTATION=+